MKLSQLLNSTAKSVPQVLLATLPVLHLNEHLGHTSIFATVPNLQTEEVSELIISVELEPSSEIDDECYTVSHTFSLDLNAHDTFESVENSVLITLQGGLIASAISCGSVDCEFKALYKAWNCKAPLEFEAPISFHIFELVSIAAQTLSQHLKSFHAIAHNN